MSPLQAQHAMTTMGSMSCGGIMESGSESDSEMSMRRACSGSSISTDFEVVVKNTFLEFRDQVEVEAAETKSVARSRSCPPRLPRGASLRQPPCPPVEAMLARSAPEGCEAKPQVHQEHAFLAVEPMVEVPPPPASFNPLSASAEAATPVAYSSPGLEQAAFPRLRGTSRKWRPSGDVFFAEACKIAESVGRMLEQTFGVSMEVQFCTLPDGSGKCTLVTTMSPGDLASLKSAVVEAAEAGVFERTNRTCGVCLLGCKADPFKPLPTGFSASLANVPVKRRECRNMYKQGFCRRGPMCNKEHPNIIVDFEFTLLAGLPLAKHDTARESLTADSAAFLF